MYDEVALSYEITYIGAVATSIDETEGNEMIKPRFRWVSVLMSAFIGSSCNFASASANPVCSGTTSIALRRTTQYGILGDDQFDTLVCGYLITHSEAAFGKKVTIAAFRITQFNDAGFRKAIEAAIKNGNTINKIQNGHYDFSLGCLKDRKITGDDIKSNQQYMDEAVQQILLRSSAKQPVAIVLSFKRHLGSDCICCHLAERVRSATTLPVK